MLFQQVLGLLPCFKPVCNAGGAPTRTNPKAQSAVVAVSCMCLLVPGGLGLLLREYLIALVSLGAAFLSFHADYVFCGDTAKAIRETGVDVHKADRHFAFFAICSVSLAVGRSPLGWTTAAALVLPLPCFFLYSRASRTSEQWNFRHSLWHAVLVVELCYVSWLLHSVR
jgi:hypothetical protein